MVIRALQLPVMGFVLLLCACNPPVPQELPADWPIPELTLPPEARLTTDFMIVNDQILSPGYSLWMAHFESPRELDEVAQHFETCLQKINYSELLFDESQMGSDRDATDREYFSPDRTTWVSLTLGPPHQKANSSNSYTVQFEIEAAPHRMLKAVENGWAELVALPVSDSQR